MLPPEAALRATAAAAPADDLPRLVLADWLEEAGDADQAAFVRAQVRAASLPAWEPFPVFVNRRRPDWRTGDPWRHTLPALDGWALAWPAEPFVRGLPAVLVVRHLPELLRRGPELFDRAPIEELHLAPTALREDWRDFARAPWLSRVRRIHFTGTSSPIEPIRALCDSSTATGVEELVFHSSASPAMPELVAGLVESPLAGRLRGLEFRVGGEDALELIEALDGWNLAGLLRLSFRTFGFSRDSLATFSDTCYQSSLSSLRLSVCRLGFGRWNGRPELPRLEQLSVDRCRLTPDDLGRLVQWIDEPGRLKRLDLGGNQLSVSAVRLFCNTPGSGVRSLGLRAARPSAAALRALLHSPLWPNLMELDLRDNPLSPPAVAALLDAEVPPDLTALLAGPHGVPDSLRAKYGDALVVGEAEADV